MKTKFEIMRANRVARPAAAALLLPIVPTMTIDGVEYVEANADDGNSCRGCAFDLDVVGCRDCRISARDAFGGLCGSHRVIYIKAA